MDVIELTIWLPDVPFAPNHPPDAVHDAAFVVDQVSVEDPPDATLVGDAEMFTVGAGTTVTVAFAIALPPAPVQESVYCVVAISAGVGDVPLVGCAPPQPPDASHDVALVELHDSCEVWPDAIELGFAARLTVGGGTDEGSEPPPPPLHAARATVATSTPAFAKTLRISRKGAVCWHPNRGASCKRRRNLHTHTFACKHRTSPP